VTLTEQTGAVSALAGADAGTEEEPELSSTVVVIARGGAHTRVSIDGPGVREPFTADVPVAKEALARRDSLCANFPRGVDMVFVDPRGRVLGLPRTTVVREVG
jgi:phosphonate C-P lyase system protein PhnH